jgi:hypothetical protein
VPDIAASGRPQENRITGRAGTVLSTPELAELDTYIAKSEYLADLAIECGFQDLAASVLRARTSDPARPRPVVGEGVCSAGRERAVKMRDTAGNLAPRPSSAGVIAVRSSR